jgi:hypothetical protein
VRWEGRPWPRRDSTLRASPRGGAPAQDRNRPRARSPGLDSIRRGAAAQVDWAHPKRLEPEDWRAAGPSHPVVRAVVGPKPVVREPAALAPNPAEPVVAPNPGAAVRLQAGPIEAAEPAAAVQPMAAAQVREEGCWRGQVPQGAAAPAVERELRTISRTCSSAGSGRHSERRRSCEDSGGASIAARARQRNTAIQRSFSS